MHYNRDPDERDTNQLEKKFKDQDGWSRACQSTIISESWQKM